VIEEYRVELDQMWETVISVKNAQGMHCICTVEYGFVSASYSGKEGELYYLLPESAPQKPLTDSTTDTPYRLLYCQLSKQCIDKYYHHIRMLLTVVYSQLGTNFLLV